MPHLVASIFRFSRFLHLFPAPPFFFFFFFGLSGELIAVYFTLVVLSSIVFAFALKKLDSLGQIYIHTSKAVYLPNVINSCFLSRISYCQTLLSVSTICIRFRLHLLFKNYSMSHSVKPIVIYIKATIALYNNIYSKLWCSFNEQYPRTTCLFTCLYYVLVQVFHRYYPIQRVYML